MDKLRISARRICMLAGCRRRHLRISSRFPFLFDKARICYKTPWIMDQEPGISGYAYCLTMEPSGRKADELVVENDTFMNTL